MVSHAGELAGKEPFGNVGFSRLRGRDSGVGEGREAGNGWVQSPTGGSLLRQLYGDSQQPAFLHTGNFWGLRKLLRSMWLEYPSIWLSLGLRDSDVTPRCHFKQ